MNVSLDVNTTCRRSRRTVGGVAVAVAMAVLAAGWAGAGMAAGGTDPVSPTAACAGAENPAVHLDDHIATDPIEERVEPVGVPALGGEIAPLETGDLLVSLRGSGFERMLHKPGEVGGTAWASMYEYMEFATQSADQYWSAVFRYYGRPEPQVIYQFPVPGQRLKGACGVTDDNTMQYCPADDTITFSQSIATRLWNGTYVGPDGQRVTGRIGDFAVAFLLGHEFAHSIQAEVGVLSRGLPIRKTELHADCWSGMWASYAGRAGLLDAGDIDEGLLGAYLVGDSQVASADHHGTSAERQVAFRKGYDARYMNECDAYLR